MKHVFRNPSNSNPHRADRVKVSATTDCRYRSPKYRLTNGHDFSSGVLGIDDAEGSLDAFVFRGDGVDEAIPQVKRLLDSWDVRLSLWPADV